MSHPDLESRAKALVDDKLIRAYWESVEHYGRSEQLEVASCPSWRDSRKIDEFMIL